MTGGERAVRQQRGRAIGRRRLLGGASWATAALALAACGGGDTAKDGGQQQPRADIFTQPTATAAPVRAIKRGGRHVAVWETEASGQFDPHVMKSGFVYPIVVAVFDGFIRQDPEDLNKLIPVLAESWETPTPTEFIFKLRKGVKFHDGSDYNAEVAKWNSERILAPGFVMEGRYTGTATGLAKIEVVDDATIKYTFDQAKADSIEAFYWVGQNISGAVPRKAADAAGKEFWRNPVGTGPYVFKQWDSGSKIVVTRNENYFGTYRNEKAPFADELHQIALPDAAVRVVSITQGNVSSTAVEPKDVKDLESKGITVIKGGPEPLIIYPNHQQGVFKDPRIRRALAYAIDREALARTVFFGQGQPGVGIPQRSKYYDPDFKGFTYDPKKAKEEMTAAGMPNGFSFECMVLPSGVRPKALEFLQAQVASLGIKVEIKPTESNAYVDRLMVRGEGDSFFALTGNLGTTETAGFDSNGHPNPGRKQNPVDQKMIDMINKIRTTLDVTERKKLIQEAQRYYFYELTAVIPVVDAFRPFAVRPEWSGYALIPPDAFFSDYRQVHQVG